MTPPEAKAHLLDVLDDIFCHRFCANFCKTARVMHRHQVDLLRAEDVLERDPDEALAAAAGDHALEQVVRGEDEPEQLRTVPAARNTCARGNIPLFCLFMETVVMKTKC